MDSILGGPLLKKRLYSLSTLNAAVLSEFLLCPCASRPRLTVLRKRLFWKLLVRVPAFAHDLRERCYSHCYSPTAMSAAATAMLRRQSSELVGSDHQFNLERTCGLKASAIASCDAYNCGIGSCGRISSAVGFDTVGMTVACIGTVVASFIGFTSAENCTIHSSPQDIHRSCRQEVLSFGRPDTCCRYESPSQMGYWQL